MGSTIFEQEIAEGRSAIDTFAQQFSNSLFEPYVGAKQIAGDEGYVKTWTKEKKGGEGSVAGYCGHLLGNAALFVGTSYVARSLPIVGKVAPLVAGGVLGYLEPIQKGDNSGIRIAHAVTGMSSLAIMEHAPRLIGATSQAKSFLEGLGRIGFSGFLAGSYNTQSESLINNKQLAGFNEMFMGGLAWAGTGAAFHTIAHGYSRMGPLGIGAPKAGTVDIIGSRWDPKCYETREFLQRNNIQFRMFDPEKNYFARKANGNGNSSHPLVLFPDGTRLRVPSPEVLAEKLGLNIAPTHKAYDTVVVGFGPGGMQAGIYGASEGLSTLAIDRLGPGGQAGTTSRVENLMGFPEGVSGSELAKLGTAQARRLGVEFRLQKAVGLETNGSERTLTLKDGKKVQGRAIVLSPGVAYRKLENIPGLDALHNKGVYYGAGTTEAPQTRGETVMVIGGANSAGQAAVNFSKYAKNVVLVSRSPLEKSMSQYLIDQIGQKPNISVLTDRAIDRVFGTDRLSGVSLKDARTGISSQHVSADSMFIFIGAEPRTNWLATTLKLNQHGFIVTGPEAKIDTNWPLSRDPMPHETSIPGVFAVGDVRAGSVKRIATAMGDGANTISEVHSYLSSDQAAPPVEASITDTRAPIGALTPPGIPMTPGLFSLAIVRSNSEQHGSKIKSVATTSDAAVRLLGNKR